MDKLRFYKVVVLVLVTVNLLTIGTIWFVKPKGPRPMPHERDMTFLSKELGMTGANKETLDALETQHHTEKRALLGKNKELREAMFALLKNNNTDSLKINQYVDSILINQKEIELMTYYHFNKVKTLCTPEQQLKLEETIAEAIRMAGGKPSKK